MSERKRVSYCLKLNYKFVYIKKEIRNIFNQCLKQKENIFVSYDGNLKIGELVLIKEEEKKLISSNTTLSQIIKGKDFQNPSCFFKFFFSFLSFCRVKQKFSEEDFKTLAIVFEKSENLFFHDILPLFDNNEKEIVLFFWKGEENKVFEIKNILEKLVFFALKDEKEQIFKLKQITLQKYFSEKLNYFSENLK